MSERRLRMGIAGLGRAFTLMLPTLVGDRRVQLVAAADPRAEATQRFAAEFGARAYDTVEALCANPDVEVVYVATPHQHHAAHVAMATSRGKHVVVEK
ncbi:MAG TPA: Gfo/Idh/MocA family oxidoreductase, partial [Casimicrobiaceae bacterium]|nr:Gfo/Idh/MocA family oxidoreductase [Casimicrobiaceae bacterium]